MDNDRCANNIRNLRFHVGTPRPLEFAKLFQREVTENLWNSLSLQQLTLDGFDLRDLYFSISTFTEIRLLTHITLWNCDFASVFFSQLTNILIKFPRLISLQNIAATLDYVDDQDIDACLATILMTCRLETLHLVWDHPRGYPRATLNAMPVLAKSLQSFSLHQKKHIHIAEEEVFYNRHGLGALVEHCHNLSQFGVQVDEYCILPQVWEAPLLPQHTSYWVMSSTPAVFPT